MVSNCDNFMVKFFTSMYILEGEDRSFVAFSHFHGAFILVTEPQDLEPPAEDETAKPRPYNPGWRVSQVPLSYDAQVQLSAVLRVIYPHVRSTPKLIIEATARVCQRWRMLATKLAEAGWEPMAGTYRKSQLPNALCCPPAFVMTAEKAARAKKTDKRRHGLLSPESGLPFLRGS